jgi:hypothetical protein
MPRRAFVPARVQTRYGNPAARRPARLALVPGIARWHLYSYLYAAFIAIVL